MNQNGVDGLLAGTLLNFPGFDGGQSNRDCTILNCTASENSLNGFELNNVFAANNNFLLKDNIALANGSNGFVYGPPPALLTSAFISNYASRNGSLNYEITGGVIQLQALHLSTGLYTSVSGDPRLTSLTNIEAVTP